MKKLHRAFAAPIAAALVLLPLTLIDQPATAAGGSTSSTIKINEVTSKGNDTVELINTGADPVDVNGWTYLDGDSTHTRGTITAASPIAPGGLFTFDSSLGLGSDDSITVFDTAGVQVASFGWPGAADPSYSRCSDGVGSFQLVQSTAATLDSANDAGCPSAADVTTWETSSVILNEVYMNNAGPLSTHPDFVEVKNVGTTQVDLSGWGVRDSKSSDWVPFPDGTVLAPGARTAMDVDTDAGFGLGGDQGDDAHLLLPDRSTEVDGITWIKDGTGDGAPGHPLPWPSSGSLGRCPDDATSKGTWQDDNTVTFGAVNDCSTFGGGSGAYDPTTDGALPWPGGQDVATTDSPDMFHLPAADGIDESFGDVSGAVFDPSDPTTMWLAKNKRGTLWRVAKQADGSWASATGWEHGKDVHFAGGTGHPDTEGLTVGPDGFVYMTSERDNSHDDVNQDMVLKFDQNASGSELTATQQWDLTTALPDVPANLGLEGVTWVPDTYLVAGGFKDQSSGAAYDPTTYPKHGTGLFLVAFEGDGSLYAFALNSDGSYHKVATIATGFPAVMDVQYDPELHAVWATCDDTCTGRYAELEPDATSGTLTRAALFARPTGMPDLNNEGMAIAPQSTCDDGSKEVVWTDDGDTGQHSLRSGTVPCTPLDNGGGDNGGGGTGTTPPPHPTTPALTTPAPTTPVVVHSVTGKPKVGKLLKVSVSVPTGARVTYRWYAGKKKIKHATKHVLKLTGKLRHQKIRVRVTVRVPGQAPVTTIVKVHRRVR